MNTEQEHEQPPVVFTHVDSSFNEDALTYEDGQTAGRHTQTNAPNSLPVLTFSEPSHSPQVGSPSWGANHPINDMEDDMLPNAEEAEADLQRILSNPISTWQEKEQAYQVMIENLTLLLEQTKHNQTTEPPSQYLAPNNQTATFPSQYDDQNVISPSQHFLSFNSGLAAPVESVPDAFMIEDSVMGTVHQGGYPSSSPAQFLPSVATHYGAHQAFSDEPLPGFHQNPLSASYYQHPTGPAPFAPIGGPSQLPSMDPVYGTSWLHNSSLTNMPNDWRLPHPDPHSDLATTWAPDFAEYRPPKQSPKRNKEREPPGDASGSNPSSQRPRNIGVTKSDRELRPRGDDGRVLQKETKTSDRRLKRHQVPSDEVPPHAKSFQRALELHTRTLWGLVDTETAPPDPPKDVLESFAVRVSSAAALNSLTRAEPSQSLPTIVQRRNGIAMTDLGSIPRHMRQIEEHALFYIQSQLSKYGLRGVWCPDLRQTPYSLYNSACRLVALDTFKQLMSADFYAEFQPNRQLISDMDLMIKLYDHFVHYSQLRRYKKNLDNPGILKKNKTDNGAIQRRRRLATARRQFGSRQKLAQRYLDMLIPAATSDDEADSEGSKQAGKAVHWIRRRPERSLQANQLVRSIDVAMETEQRLDGTRRRISRHIRLLPGDLANQKSTAFHSLPNNVPLDYFHPDYFNELSRTLRSRITNSKVAFVPNVSFTMGKHPDEKLNDTKFIEKHGDTIKQNYHTVVATEDTDTDGEFEIDNVSHEPSQSSVDASMTEGDQSPKEN